MQIPDKIISRDKIIVRTGVIGIIANVILSVFKGFIGFLTNSIAIMVDAVNNLRDALSSVITIVGLKLANKKPDKEHPYGHGRIEYLKSQGFSVNLQNEQINAFFKGAVKRQNLKISIIIKNDEVKVIAFSGYNAL